MKSPRASFMASAALSERLSMPTGALAAGLAALAVRAAWRRLLALLHDGTKGA